MSLHFQNVTPSPAAVAERITNQRPGYFMKTLPTCLVATDALDGGKAMVGPISGIIAKLEQGFSKVVQN